MNQGFSHTFFSLPEFDKIYKKEAVAALNEVAEELRDIVAGEVSEHYNIRKDYVRSKTDIYKANEESLKARVVIRGKKLALIEFNAQQTPAGVRVEIERGKPKTIKGAFIATGKKSGRNVFRRIEIGGKRVWRLPITKLQFIGIAGIVRKINLHGTLIDYMSARLPAAFSSRLNQAFTNKSVKP